MADKSQKTEQPTQHRLQKTRREGRFPVSRDFISGLQFLTIFVVALRAFDNTALGLVNLFRMLLRRAGSTQDFTITSLHSLYAGLVFPFLAKLLLSGAVVMALLLLIQLASTGFGFATKQLLPDVKRLNPMSRLSQMPLENAASTVRSIILLAVVSVLVYTLISSEIPELGNLAGASLTAGLSESASIIKRLLERLTSVLLVFGLIDFARQRSKFQKNLRMSKQEIKDEMRDVEGNAQMKMRIRRLQRDALRRNMIKSISKATVVVVNPTHYAIAIRYEMGTRSVPTVVAKGKNYLAQIIKERAKEHDIPIVENKPLAQALYQAVDVGGEIPPALYRAVAEVLAQIYRILNRQ